MSTEYLKDMRAKMGPYIFIIHDRTPTKTIVRAGLSGEYAGVFWAIPGGSVRRHDDLCRWAATKNLSVEVFEHGKK